MDQDEKRNIFEKIYHQESDRVFRYIMFRLSDREEVLDIVEESFYKLWQKIVEGEAIENPRAWLLRVARNRVIDTYKKRKAVSLEEMTYNEEDEYSTDIADPDAHHKLEISVEASYVLEKIEELPKQYRDIIRMRYMDDLSPKEISEILEISANAASLRINHALQKLREIIIERKEVDTK